MYSGLSQLAGSAATHVMDDESTIPAFITAASMAPLACPYSIAFGANVGPYCGSYTKVLPCVQGPLSRVLRTAGAEEGLFAPQKPR